MSVVTHFTPPTPSVANNAVSVVFDSTRSFASAPSSTTVGDFRGRHPSTRIAGVALCTDQNVTLRLDYLKSDGTWVTGAKSQTCTAGTDQPIDWLASASDWRVVVANGATGPTALTLYGWHITKGDRASGA